MIYLYKDMSIKYIIYNNLYIFLIPKLILKLTSIWGSKEKCRPIYIQTTRRFKTSGSTGIKHQYIAKNCDDKKYQENVIVTKLTKSGTPPEELLGIDINL